MSRLNVVNPATATGDTKAMFDGVNSLFGVVPNFIRVMANSPNTLNGFLGLHAALGRGSIGGQTTERIALAISEDNSCEYCVAAHTALAKGAGLSDNEIDANRKGTSIDPKAAAAVAFAKALVENRGNVTSAEFDAVRKAGHSDGEIVEIIAHVALNTLLNYLGKTGSIDIDFPRVPLLKTA